MMAWMSTFWRRPVRRRAKARSWPVELGGAAAGRGDVAGELAQLGLVGELAVKDGGVAEDAGEEVVEVVGDAAGELADGFHHLGLPQMLLGRELIGDVAAVDEDAADGREVAQIPADDLEVAPGSVGVAPANEGVAGGAGRGGDPGESGEGGEGVVGVQELGDVPADQQFGSEAGGAVTDGLSSRIVPSGAMTVMMSSEFSTRARNRISDSRSRCSASFRSVKSRTIPNARLAWRSASNRTVPRTAMCRVRPLGGMMRYSMSKGAEVVSDSLTKASTRSRSSGWTCAIQPSMLAMASRDPGPKTAQSSSEKTMRPAASRAPRRRRGRGAGPR
jgi:hypothetical protein